MYVLTNIEVEATHKVLKNATGPGVDNSLPEADRKTIRDLLKGLGTYIDNGLPEDPDQIDNTLPSTERPGNALPPPTAQPKS